MSALEHDGLTLLDADECCDFHGTGEGCGGEVVLRPSLSGTGVPIPRCDVHWQKRLDWQEEHDRIYPDSDLPPEWFDPEAAGESWDED